MRRINLTYSVPEEEFDKEIVSLLSSSAQYLEDFSGKLREVCSEAEIKNYKSCLEKVAKLRDCLAYADFRLHDGMSLLQAYNNSLDSDVNKPEDPNQAIEELDNRMQQVRENMSELGLDVSEDEIRKMLKENTNDSVS
jgi:DNA repair ATPase RecN